VRGPDEGQAAVDARGAANASLSRPITLPIGPSVRDVQPHEIEATPGPFVAVGARYDGGHHVARHRHWRAQFLYAAEGVALVDTDLGNWVVPPERAVWIPAEVAHEVTMLAPVDLLNLYVAPSAAAALPQACRVVGVSALAASLLREAAELTPSNDPASREHLIYSLLLLEIARAPELPLTVPFPGDPRLAARCRRYLEQPSPHQTIDDWCEELAMSRRSFTRRFRAETGFGFAAWCRQACLLAALPRLAAGVPITTIAFDLGYDSASAFATMFRRTLGAAPSRFLAAA
jgi:AraC-like DNA-binding protein